MTIAPPTCLRKLAEIGSAPLCLGDVCVPETSFGSDRAEELLSLAAVKNGFYAFESALHVLPLSDESAPMTVNRWNAEECWKRDYGGAVLDCLFFAVNLYPLDAVKAMRLRADIWRQTRDLPDGARVRVTVRW